MILFNKKIELKTHYCRYFDDELEEVDEPYVNVQIKINGCNANCSFCNSKNGPSLDEDKYYSKLEKISEKVRIRKLNLSGGEPTLDFEKLKRILLKTREILPNVYMAINTNGYNFEKLFENDLYKIVDNIQLSRHHYVDEINNEILGFNSISKDIIHNISKELSNKRFLNLSCNLINGYIDDEKEIFNFLEESSKIDIRWVGFVTLISLNEYCENNIIKFNDMNLLNDRFVITNRFTFKNLCKCYGYVYIPTDGGDPIRVYNKQTEKSDDIKNILVFDGENFNIGFTNNVLI